MKKIALVVSTVALALLPAVSFAQTFNQGNQFSQYLNGFIAFINNTLVPLVFGLAFLVFIWGVFKYFILGGGDEGKREEGRSLMLYAIIGFVLMVSVWGIVNLLAEGLGLRTEDVQQIPNVPLTNR